MSRPILTAAEMRAAEQCLFDAGTSVEALMERAGQGVAEAVWRYAAGAPALILCGSGNNGGDGYVVARVLADRGVDVTVAALADPRTPAAIAARAGWGGPVIPIAAAIPRAVLVDALFGTGLGRPLEAGLAARLDLLAAGARQRIAVDLPSGLEADAAGFADGVPCFDLTVALGALKPAHCLAAGARLCGRVAIVDLGIDASAAQLHAIQPPSIAEPRPDAHKYTRGQVAVVAGAMPGAARLAATAAFRGGAGYVTLVGAADDGPAAIVRRPAGDLAAVLGDERLRALLIGPGLGRDDDAWLPLERALRFGGALVLDGDALALVAEDPRALAGRTAPTILTPHAGEFRRLFPTIAGDLVTAARAAAAASGAVVVAKAPATVVAAPDGRAGIAPLAPGWLASAGTGDVLAGLVAGRAAGGGDAFFAACDAVWLHGAAARIAGPGLIADDLPDVLPAVIAGLA